jgi:hypothetical protein
MKLDALVPEARAPAAAAAAVLIEHTEPWFIALVAHGSAVKGGVMPGWSDLDLQLYLSESAFRGDGLLPLRLAIEVHRDLSNVDPAPFHFISCLPVSPGSSRAIPLVAGAYVSIAGQPPGETSADDLRDAGVSHLTSIGVEPPLVIYGLLEHGGDRLAHTLR